MVHWWLELPYSCYQTCSLGSGAQVGLLITVCRRCSEVELDVEFFGFVKFYEIFMKYIRCVSC